MNITTATIRSQSTPRFMRARTIPQFDHKGIRVKGAGLPKADSGRLPCRGGHVSIYSGVDQLGIVGQVAPGIFAQESRQRQPRLGQDISGQSLGHLYIFVTVQSQSTLGPSSVTIRKPRGGGPNLSGEVQMSGSPESVVRRFLVAWEDMPKLDRILSFFAEDAVWVDGQRGVHRGIDAITSELEAQAAIGFSSFRAEIKSLVADGGTVMMERVDSLTIDGKPFSMEIMAAFEIGADGRIMRWRDSYDLTSITDQVASAGFAAPA